MASTSPSFPGSEPSDIIAATFLGLFSLGAGIALVKIIENWSAGPPASASDTGAAPREAGLNKSSGASKVRGLANVAGMHHLKSLLEREVVAPFARPERFRRYRLSPPNGVLMFGPPGCGKTYIAEHLAEELGHTFIEVTPAGVGSPYVHESSLKIADLFATAALKAPSVLFIDELEAMVPPRHSLSGGSEYKSEEITSFLLGINNCSEHGIFLIGATNEPWSIDPAILRTGRIDKIIYVEPPDLRARMEMLRLHFAGRPVERGISARAIARKLAGYSASDIAFLADEAARIACEQNVAISEECIRGALESIPPSVTSEVAERYRVFGERGIRRPCARRVTDDPQREDESGDFDLGERERAKRQRRRVVVHSRHRFAKGTCRACGAEDRGPASWSEPCRERAKKA